MIADYARAAFATGYAQVESDTTLPMPATVREACRLAMEAVVEHESADILEAVRHHAAMMAVRVASDRHRDEIEASFHKRLQPITAQLLHRIAPSLAHTAAGTFEATRDQIAYWTSVIQRLLDQLDGNDLWQQLETLTQEASMSGAALGSISAGDYLAASQGQPVADFATAFPAKLDALRTLGDRWDASSWVAQQIHGLAYDLGGDLADAVETGASYDELLGIIQSYADLTDNGASLLLDHAIATAVTDEAWALYQSEGLDMVDALVMPDAEEICQGIEEGNPYTLDDAENLIPAHLRCRCALTPHLGG